MCRLIVFELLFVLIVFNVMLKNTIVSLFFLWSEQSVPECMKILCALLCEILESAYSPCRTQIQVNWPFFKLMDTFG